MDKAYTLGQSAHLFDHATGEFVGVVDNNGKETMLVKYEVDPVTGVIAKIAKLTQAQYDALAIKDDSTLYVIVAG